MRVNMVTASCDRRSRQAAVAKATKTLLRTFVRPIFGQPHRLIRRFYISVVLPRAGYELSVWYTPVRECSWGKRRCCSVAVAHVQLQRV